MIIGITGTLGAGKGTIVEYLLTKGFKHYSATGLLTEEVAKRGMSLNRDSLVFVANDLRSKFGPGYIAEELYKKAKADGGNSVIESLRSIGEVESLKKIGEFVLFAIDADPEIRYSRIIERAGPKDNVSFDVFVSNEQREMNNTDPSKGNIRACMGMADYSFKNDWTREELQRKIQVILEQINKKNIVEKNEPVIVSPVTKKENVLSWDDYFMSIAILSAKRSKDPNTQVGACIIDSEKRIIGVGYNGFPRGCSDEEFPWTREGDFLNVKYSYVCHAELNAILNSSGRDLSNSSIYVALFPCNECAKAIIQVGIKEVVYLSDKYANTDSAKASRRMLISAGIKLRQFSPENNSVNISLTLD